MIKMPVLQSRRMRLILLGLAIAFLAVAVTLIIIWEIHVNHSMSELRAVLDETDRVDPGWRMAQLLSPGREPELSGTRRNAEIIQLAWDQFPRS